MQPKKIFAIILITIFAVAICLIAIPVSRTYRADIIVNADLRITSRTLLDTSNWDKWYYDTSATLPAFSDFQTTSNKKHELFDYTVVGTDEQKKGQVQLLRSNKNNWDTKITWVEEIVCKSNIAKKFQLLFHPSPFRASFLRNMVQFKNHIENPDNVFGGLTFERKEIPSNKIVLAYDTVRLDAIENSINSLYKKVSESLPAEEIVQPGTFLSQYEKLDDSTIQLCVAVGVSDQTNAVKTPFELLEVDQHQAIIIHTVRNYTEINEDISVMYEWLKKNDARPATGYWVKHDLNKDVAQGPDKNTLTIIQEIYSLK